MYRRRWCSVADAATGREADGSFGKEGQLRFTHLEISIDGFCRMESRLILTETRQIAFVASAACGLARPGCAERFRRGELRL